MTDRSASFKDEIQVEVTDLTGPLAMRALQEWGAVESTVLYTLQGRRVNDSSRPITVDVYFFENPRPLPGLVDSPDRAVIFLPLADLPAWLPLLSAVPFRIFLEPGDGNSINVAGIFPADLHDQDQQRLREMRTNPRG